MEDARLVFISSGSSLDHVLLVTYRSHDDKAACDSGRGSSILTIKVL
jgi:hypothetical protein